MPATEQSILVENDDTVRTIRLNRPDVLNAFDTPMLRALSKAVREAARDKGVRCLVLTGNGRAFSSGQDLAETSEKYKNSEPLELGQHLRDLYNPIITSLRTMEKPVIAAINGVAAGAGLSVALAADLRIAAESASFIQVFINVGVIPDAGGTFMLPRLVGLSRALELAFTGRKVKAEEALRIGLVNQIAPDDELAEVTSKLARKLAELPTKTMGLIKRGINASWGNDLRTQLAYEAELQTTAGQSYDHREGVMAFLEKRPAKFEGR